MTKNNMTIKEILADDVYGETFLTAFHAMLEKFVNEYDDMAQMEMIRQASELLDTINNG